MGCDIHLRVQVRVGDGTWQDVPEEQLGPGWHYDRASDSGYAHERSYMLFARLAGVRDYSNTITPLFEGRGVPEDLRGVRYQRPRSSCEDPGSPDYDEAYASSLAQQRRDYPEWDDWEHQPDYHSHTWATFAELREADWRVKHHWEVRTTVEVYRRWRDEGQRPTPDEVLYQDEDHPDVMVPAEVEAGEAAVGTQARAEFARRMMSDQVSVQYVVVSEPLLETGFLAWIWGPAAEALVQRHGADGVRMLICFDN